MSLLFSPPPSLTGLSLHPHVHFSPSMSILRRLPLNLRTTRRRRLATVSAALRQDTAVWTPAPLSEVEHAAESLFHIAIDVSDAPDLAASHTLAGQYLQLRLPDALKPSFLAIASPPKLAAARGVFEFLVKSVAGSTAEALCALKRGDVVELSQVMGNGFNIDRIHPPKNFGTVLVFATGSGIRSVLQFSIIPPNFILERRISFVTYSCYTEMKVLDYRYSSTFVTVLDIAENCK